MRPIDNLLRLKTILNFILVPFSIATFCLLALANFASDFYLGLSDDQNFAVAVAILYTVLYLTRVAVLFWIKKEAAADTTKKTAAAAKAMTKRTVADWIIDVSAALWAAGILAFVLYVVITLMLWRATV